MGERIKRNGGFAEYVTNQQFYQTNKVYSGICSEAFPLFSTDNMSDLKSFSFFSDKQHPFLVLITVLQTTERLYYVDY